MKVKTSKVSIKLKYSEMFTTVLLSRYKADIRCALPKASFFLKTLKRPLFAITCRLSAYAKEREWKSSLKPEENID